jgi:D-ribose pyranase
MKKTGVLNPDIIAAIAALGHTDSMVIADVGLPIPKDVPCIDISLTKGIPSFQQTLKAVAKDLVIESFVLAEETPKKNPAVLKGIQTVLSGVPGKKLPHDAFKKLTAEAKAVIRTGESSPYANVILIAGVNF